MNLLKKKMKIYLLSAFLILIPVVILGGTIAAAGQAVSSFGHTVSSFISGVIDGIYDFLTGNKALDLDNITLSELMEAVKEEDVFTEKTLDDMMISRDMFLYLLEKTEQFNTRITSVDAYVEVYDNWYDTDASKYYTDEVMEEINQLGAMGLTDAVFQKMNEIEMSRWKTSRVLLPFSFTDYVAHSFPLEWQYLYLFASYNAIAESLGGKEARIRKSNIDYVFDHIAPKIQYDDTPLSTKESERITIRMSDLGVFRVTVPYECSNSCTEEMHTYYGTLPCYTAEKAEDLLGTHYIEYSISNGQVEYFIAGTDNYLAMLYAAGERLCNGFVLDIFIDQLRSLPGGNALADTIQFYQDTYVDEGR